MKSARRSRGGEGVARGSERGASPTVELGHRTITPTRASTNTHTHKTQNPKSSVGAHLWREVLGDVLLDAAEHEGAQHRVQLLDHVLAALGAAHAEPLIELVGAAEYVYEGCTRNRCESERGERPLRDGSQQRTSVEGVFERAVPGMRKLSSAQSS